ncbi:MAG TPA: hypothetical protein DCS07_05010, partial [Bdellovibrionales bacterium]|nr:hypothetical protein [Bdellovibrionales bacterium]
MRFTWIPCLVVAFAFAGCARAPLKTEELSPRILIEEACGKAAPGARVESLKGSVWLKAQSKEAAGQFPATLEVKRSGTVLMEVTNLVGGVEAVIRVEG